MKKIWKVLLAVWAYKLFQNFVGKSTGSNRHVEYENRTSGSSVLSPPSLANFWLDMLCDLAKSVDQFKKWVDKNPLLGVSSIISFWVITFTFVWFISGDTRPLKIALVMAVSLAAINVYYWYYETRIKPKDKNGTEKRPRLSEFALFSLVGLSVVILLFDLFGWNIATILIFALYLFAYAMGCWVWWAQWK